MRNTSNSTAAPGRHRRRHARARRCTLSVPGRVKLTRMSKEATAAERLRIVPVIVAIVPSSSHAVTVTSCSAGLSNSSTACRTATESNTPTTHSATASDPVVRPTIAKPRARWLRRDSPRARASEMPPNTMASTAQIAPRATMNGSHAIGDGDDAERHRGGGETRSGCTGRRSADCGSRIDAQRIDVAHPVRRDVAGPDRAVVEAELEPLHRIRVPAWRIGRI